MSLRPRQGLAYLTPVVIAIFVAAHCWYVLHTVSGVSLSVPSWMLLGGKTGVELLAGSYGIAFLLSSVAFLMMRDHAADVAGIAPQRSDVRIGIIYLCFNDADWSALESLTRLSYTGPIHVVIHDDSPSETERAAVDRMAVRLASARPWRVDVLRRPDRAGGKAGAVNYALDRTAHLYDWFLLCDNDSTVLQPDTIERALMYVDVPDSAGVQFRSTSVSDPAYCGVNRRLAEAIGAFHAFLAPASRYGWMPFIGHNALLRTSAVRQVGGLTPGFFSDDLDLTVRLNLAGYRIAYAPEIAMGEKHPPSYTAFRKRSYKWAYGCVQTLRAHWKHVLTSRQFSLAEKVWFFQFSGFYCLQCLLLGYLAFALIAVPLGVLGTFVPDLFAGLVVGVVLVGLVYAPLLSFYVKRRANRTHGWTTTLALCGLVYGGTDFSVLRGVSDAFMRRRRAWVPTNGVAATAVDGSLFLEGGFGLLLLSVPILYMPEVMYLPSWFLFAGKFLFGPALSLAYRDEPYHAPATVTDDRRHALPDLDLVERVGAVVGEQSGAS